MTQASSGDVRCPAAPACPSPACAHLDVHADGCALQGAPHLLCNAHEPAAQPSRDGHTLIWWRRSSGRNVLQPGDVLPAPPSEVCCCSATDAAGWQHIRGGQTRHGSQPPVRKNCQLDGVTLRCIQLRRRARCRQLPGSCSVRPLLLGRLLVGGWRAAGSGGMRRRALDANVVVASDVGGPPRFHHNCANGIDQDGRTGHHMPCNGSDGTCPPAVAARATELSAAWWRAASSARPAHAAKLTGGD